PSLPSVYVAAFGSQGGPAGVRLLDALRLAGLSAQSDYRATTLKGHLRQADRSGCRFAVLLGDDEAKSGSAVVLNIYSFFLDSVSLPDLPRYFLSLFKGF